MAGINGKDEAQTLSVGDLSKLGNTITLFADGVPWAISSTTPKAVGKAINCRPRGGFVMVIK